MGAETPQWAGLVRRVAAANPGIADYRQIADLVLNEMRGGEVDLLNRLLPGYVRAVLSRGSGGSTDDAWESFLDERLSTMRRGTIFMRDAEVEEIDEAATRRFRFAGNLDKRGQRFQAVAAALRENSVTTVGEIPLAVGRVAIRDLEMALLQKRAARMSAAAKAEYIKPLKALRDRLQRAAAKNEPSDTVVLLQRRRFELADELDVLIWKGRELAILREVLSEMRHG